MVDLPADAVADDHGAAPAEGFHRLAIRTADRRAARRVDEVPGVPEPDGGHSFGEVEPAIVERRYGDAIACSVAPQAVFGKEFGTDRSVFAGAAGLWGIADGFGIAP